VQTIKTESTKRKHGIKDVSFHTINQNTMMAMWKILLFLTQAVAVATASYAACSANPSCSGLVDDCCPTSAGVTRKCNVLPKQQIVFVIMLTSNFWRYSYNIVECCDGDPVVDASCYANSACNSLGLIENCCPTAAGAYVSIIHSI
jgi:hypothetical protein